MEGEWQSLRDEFEKLIACYPEDKDLHGHRFEDFLALSESELAEFKARVPLRHKGSVNRLHAEGRVARANLRSKEAKKRAVSPYASPQVAIHLPVSQYAEQLQALDGELAEICAAFHAADPPSSSSFSDISTARALRIHKLCQAKQQSVTMILTCILNDKKLSLPYLKIPQNIPRPKGLQVGRVLDRSAEGLLLAARLANKPFKQAVRQLAARVGIPTGRVVFGPVKTLAGISRKLGDSTKNQQEQEENKQEEQVDVFDLNRATIVFESEAELRTILDELPRSFAAIVYLKNKFEEQWERAEQPPCLHLNLRLRPESLPAELVALLETGTLDDQNSSWVVELQLSMRDFLDVKQRCHAIYEILRLNLGGTLATALATENKLEVRKPGLMHAIYAVFRGAAAETKPSRVGITTGEVVAKLPRGCPVCGLLQHFVPRSQLSQLEDVALGGQKLVRRGQWRGQTVAYNLMGIGTEAQLLSFRKTFLREVGLLTRLEHPNIVQILGVVREPNELGFLAEWVPQGSLHSWLHDPVLSQQLDVWEVALQLCEALIYLHDNGVVHYDLKSHNVLCSCEASSQVFPAVPQGWNSWVVKLADFGLSRELMSSLHTRVQVGGTPNWQAPETWKTVGSFHSSADVYAFGCLLIELFGHKNKPGCFPWMELTNRKEIKRRVRECRELPPELEFLEEAKVRAVCEECLAFEADKRPSMRKVRARLQAAQVESKLLDSGVRRILEAMDSGRVNFPSLFSKLQAGHPSSWSHTVSMLEKYSKLGARFQVALAMCRHFQSVNEQLRQRKITGDNNRQQQQGEKGEGGKSLSSLLAVCERLKDEVVCAKFVCGYCHEQGIGGAERKDEVKAEKYYQQATAVQGYAEAKFRLAMIILFREKGQQGVESQKTDALLLLKKKKEEASNLLQQAAKQGHANSQLILAKCYQLGEGVEPDHNLAMHWLGEGLKTLEQDNQNEITGLLKLELELKGDYTELVQMAASYVKAGKCYENGVGVEKDLEEAVRFYRLASNQGYPVAQHSLGYCYETGVGVEKDLEEAARLYRLASNQGYADAQFHLGSCYKTGVGVEKDLEEAARLFRLASDQGLAVAQYNLGYCYEHGEGVNKNLKKAARLFRLASVQGLAVAQNNLGYCYEHGEGVNKNLNKAAILFGLASDQGLADAQYNLGRCYKHGYGVNQNLKEAARLFGLAADQGHIHAQMFAHISQLELGLNSWSSS